MANQKFKTHLSDHQLEQAVVYFQNINRVETIYRNILSVMTETQVEKMQELVQEYHSRMKAFEYLIEKGMEYEVLHKRYAGSIAETMDKVREAGIVRGNFQIALERFENQKIRMGVFE